MRRSETGTQANRGDGFSRDGLKAARSSFRAAVLERDGGRCVCCAAPAEDAHHIMDRKLFADGGYDADNGASVCGPCHLLAESTEITCHRIRTAAGIGRTVLPEGFDPKAAYDKWGNEMLEGGLLLAGPLADDDGCVRSMGSARRALLVRDDGLPLPRWVGYSFSDPDSRALWRRDVADLVDETAPGGLYEGFLFHGTGSRTAEAILDEGMDPTEIASGDGPSEGSFWGTALAAAWYAEDTALNRDRGAPAIVAADAAGLEAQADIVPDPATIDFPEFPTKTRAEAAVVAEWEALGPGAGWRDALRVWAAVVALHELPLDPAGWSLAASASPANGAPARSA